MSQAGRASQRRQSRARRRRRLYPLLLVVCVLVGAAAFLGLRSGADADTATTGPHPSTSGSTTSPAPGRSAVDTLPATLPANAVAVDAPILMYHYVADTPPPKGPYADGLTVRTDDFRAEMQYLVDNGYETVSLADLYLAMAGMQDLPAKPVALTFDDGGLDNYEVAFPILQEHGLVGTFFVITKTVGGDGQMTWDHLREMAAAGMSIQSHTVSHPDLRGVPAARLESELADSSQAIADGVGERSYVLSYPAGAYNGTVIEATKAAGYVMAVTTDQGAEGQPSAVYELTRRRVQAHLPPESFARLVD